METKQHMQEGGVSVIQLPSPDSLSTASVKEYAPSFSSEPPPAYHKPRSTAVQVARIAGITLVAASAILGAFLLAAAWINTRYACTQHVIVPMPASQTQVHEHLPSFDRLVDPLKASDQKLEETKVEEVGNELKNEDHDKVTTEETKKDVEEEAAKDEDSEEEEEEEESDQGSDEIPIQIRLPLQLDFDELAGMLMERNMRSRMNCVVEKKRAEEVVEHHPRTLQLPFGLNLTTDPRHERVSGERMAIFCESGHDQMQQQQRRPEMPFEFIPLMPEQRHQQPEPIVLPLPGPIHLPFQFAGPMQQQPHQQPPHPQAPHLEEPHLQGSMPHPQQPIHMINPFQHAQMIHHLQQQQQHQEMLRRQMLEQEALESMRPPPPPPAPSAHQLPPQHGPVHQMPQQHGPVHQMPQQHGPVHQMPQMGHLPAHGPIMMELTEMSPEEVASHEGIPMGRAMRGPMPQRLPVHLPMQGNIRGPGIQAPEQHRPHYVQPRSVPSDPFVAELHRRDKRVKKRCACDCAC